MAKRKSTPIRRLQPGEPIPDGEPKRYVTYHGYVVLRWRTSGGFVEVHEHRLNAGMPPRHLVVHHINGDKLDNRPQNLKVMTPSHHAGLAITFDAEEAAALYRSGWTFPNLSRKYGVHQVSIMRALKNRGLQPRQRPQDQTHCKNGHEFTPENTYRWGKTNSRSCRACNRVRQAAYARSKRVGGERIERVSVTRGGGQ